MKFNLEDLAIPAILFVCAALIVGVVWLTLEEGKKWDAFSKGHACKKVGEMSGSTQTGVGFGVTANGQMGTVVTTTNTPSKIGWLCDDGVTYWR